MLFKLKKRIGLLFTATALFALIGCGQQPTETVAQVPTTVPDVISATTEVVESQEEVLPAENGSSVLVAYFSCTGNTAPLAQYAADYLLADLYEIIPAVPYTDSDIAYNHKDCRANLEQADETRRPAISGELIEMEQYDTVILAFPIWWGKEPRILDTFLESYDFSGKTMVAFCTSGSSGISTAERNLQSMTGNTVTWLGAERFASGTSKEAIIEWLQQIGF